MLPCFCCPASSVPAASGAVEREVRALPGAAVECLSTNPIAISFIVQLHSELQYLREEGEKSIGAVCFQMVKDSEGLLCVFPFCRNMFGLLCLAQQHRFLLAFVVDWICRANN